MPYISEVERRALDAPLDELCRLVCTDGQLNYAVMRLALGRVKSAGLCYSTLAAVCGTLKLAADELFRRLVAPYEDHKIRNAGDLPDFMDLTRNGNR